MSLLLGGANGNPFNAPLAIYPLLAVVMPLQTWLFNSDPVYSQIVNDIDGISNVQFANATNDVSDPDLPRASRTERTR